MHPILGQLRRLLLYLAAWGPISAILIYLFASVGGMSWVRALAMAVPLALVYAFMCLSAWYTCRVVPLANSGSWLAHLAAAAVASLLWIATARFLGFGLAIFSSFAGIDQQIARAYPILFRIGVLLYLLALAHYYVPLDYL